MANETNPGAGISLLPDVLAVAKTLEGTEGPIALVEHKTAKPKGTKTAKATKPKPVASVLDLPTEASGVHVTVAPGGAMAVAGVGGQSVAQLIGSGVYPVTLPPALHDRLRKQITGVGGWQTLMGQLRECTMPDIPVCMLPRDLLLAMVPKAVVHGSGGYQGVIRWLLCLVLEQHTATILAPAAK